MKSTDRTAYQKSYYLRNKELLREKHKLYRNENKEKIAVYALETREKYAEYHKNYSAKYELAYKEKRKTYRLVNKDKIAEAKNKLGLAAYAVQYRKNNPLKCNMATAKYKSAKLNRTPKWQTLSDIFEVECIYTYRNSLQRIGLRYHVDHIIPLQGKFVSGLHTPLNMQILHHVENSAKGNRFEL